MRQVHVMSKWNATFDALDGPCLLLTNSIVYYFVTSHPLQSFLYLCLCTPTRVLIRPFYLSPVLQSSSMMKVILGFVLLAVSTALAIPASPAKRQSTKAEDATTIGTSDVSILTYALILEHLEDNFYRGGLANFTQAQFAAAGFSEAFYTNLV